MTRTRKKVFEIERLALRGSECVGSVFSSSSPVPDDYESKSQWPQLLGLYELYEMPETQRPRIT